MENYKKGDKCNVYLDEHLEDGRGISFGDNNELILIDNVNEGDENIKIEITNTFTRLIKARRMNRIHKEEDDKIPAGGIVSPYELDNDDEEFDDDEDYEEEDGED